MLMYKVITVQSVQGVQSVQSEMNKASKYDFKTYVVTENGWCDLVCSLCTLIPVLPLITLFRYAVIDNK